MLGANGAHGDKCVHWNKKLDAMNLYGFVYAASLKIKMFWMRHKKNVFLGKHVTVDWGAKIYVGKGGRVELGDGCYLKAAPKNHHTGLPFRASICCAQGATVALGTNTRSAAYISAHKNVRIGQGCLLAGGVNIMDSNGVRVSSAFRADWRQDKAEDVIIGDNVWICINSVILKGTTIGNNCIVSANSVVKGNFPDNVLIQGNPAVVVKELKIQKYAY